MSSTTSPSGTSGPVERPEPLVSLPHVFGSALAAACATAAASYFGIAGTIIGAVAASVIATVVSATSTHSLRRAPRLALASAGVLAIVTLAVTGLEGVAGKPLSSMFDDGATGGTTLGRALPGDSGKRTTVRSEVTDDEPAESPAPTPEPGGTGEASTPATPVPEEDQPDTTPPADPMEPPGSPESPGSPEPTPADPGS